MQIAIGFERHGQRRCVDVKELDAIGNAASKSMRRTQNFIRLEAEVRN